MQTSEPLNNPDQTSLASYGSRLHDMTIQSSTEQQSVFSTKRIDKLFERMQAFYGARFTDMWRHISDDASGKALESIKATWSTGLEEFDGKVLAAALHACMDKHAFPPTLPEFRMLCKLTKQTHDRDYSHRPPPGPSRLSAEDRKAIDGMRAEAKRILADRVGKIPGLDWAEKLLAKAADGYKLDPIQQSLAETAVRNRARTSAEAPSVGEEGFR